MILSEGGDAVRAAENYLAKENAEERKMHKVDLPLAVAIHINQVLNDHLSVYQAIQRDDQTRIDERTGQESMLSLLANKVTSALQTKQQPLADRVILLGLNTAEIDCINTELFEEIKLARSGDFLLNVAVSLDPSIDKDYPHPSLQRMNLKRMRRASTSLITLNKRFQAVGGLPRPDFIKFRTGK